MCVLARVRACVCVPATIRLDADAQKAIDGNDAGQQSDEDAFSHCSSHDDHDHTEDVHDVFKKASVL